MSSTTTLTSTIPLTSTISTSTAKNNSDIVIIDYNNINETEVFQQAETIAAAVTKSTLTTTVSTTKSSTPGMHNVSF